MNSINHELKRQLPRNALFSVLNFAIYSVSAFWLTPYLVGHLGAAAYGLVPIAALFTQYVALITSQISGSVTRFLTIEIQKPGGNPNIVFNSAFALYLILVAVQLPILGLGLFYADKLFSIPPGLRTDVLLLLGCSGAGFLLTLVAGVFSVSLFSRNRLDIGYLFNVGRLVARLALIILLFALLGPRLRYIGFIDLALEVAVLAFSVVVWRKFTPELSISFRLVDWTLLKPIFKMSSWTLLNQMGALLYLRSDIWIINRFISPEAAGRYAAVLVIGNFIRQIGTQFSSQFAPSIMNYWAVQDMASLRRLLVFMVKMLSFGIAVPVGFLCANGGAVLGLWLGKGFADLSLLLLVLCIHLPVNTAVQPLFLLNTASNSVEVPALVTFALGVVNLIVAYVLGVAFGMGALGVALATAVVLTLKNALFTPAYGAHVMKQSPWPLFSAVFGSSIMLGAVFLLSRVPVAAWLHLRANALAGLAARAVFIGAVAAILGWFLVLTKDEKRVLASVVAART